MTDALLPLLKESAARGVALGVVNVASQLGRLRQKTHKASAGGRRGVLKDLGPPWVEAVTVGHEAASRPLFSTLALADTAAEVLDSRAVNFLFKQALKERKKEEEAKKRREEKEQLLAGLRTPAQIRGLDKICAEVSASLSAQLERRKRKKKKFPRTSSLRGTRLQSA